MIKQNVQLFLQVENLFDTRPEYAVYSSSGRATESLEKELFRQNDVQVGGLNSLDLQTLERLVFESDDQSAAHDAFMKRFWSDRNLAMFEKLEASFGTPSHQLVAVGTGHLLGDLGLVRLFEQKGYLVEHARAEGPGAAWVAPWYVEKGEGFTLSFPAAPTRKVTPIAEGAQTAVTMWQGGAFAYAIEVTSAPNLGKALDAQRQTIFKATVDELAKGRKVISSEQVEFLGRPALHAVIEGGTPELPPGDLGPRPERRLLLVARGVGGRAQLGAPRGLRAVLPEPAVGEVTPSPRGGEGRGEGWRP